MREVLYIANSEGLKCEEYKLMKNKRYLSDVPEKLSTAIQLASKRFVISDVLDCPFICGQPPLILFHQPESAFCSAKVSEFHDAFFSSDHFANFATFAKGSTYPLLLSLN